MSYNVEQFKLSKGRFLDFLDCSTGTGTGVHNLYVLFIPVKSKKELCFSGHSVSRGSNDYRQCCGIALQH